MIYDVANNLNPLIIAEIGCNHQGDLATACRMIKILGGGGTAKQSSHANHLNHQAAQTATTNTIHDAHTAAITPSSNISAVSPYTHQSNTASNNASTASLDNISSSLLENTSTPSPIHVAKFQKRTNRELLTEKQFNAPHPNPKHSYGATYGLHREFLEFDLAQHQLLKACCEEEGLIYSSSVWDLTAAKEIASLAPSLIKVPSACNLDFAMLGFLRDCYGGKIHLSLGMTTQAEEERIVQFFEAQDRAKDLTLYACTSGYPVPFDEIYLNEIVRLKRKFGNTVAAIGFSGHHLGIGVDVAALALGAEVFERHFTLDRTLKGTDHAASLEPNEIFKLAYNLQCTKKALRYKPTEMTHIEMVQRKKLKTKLEATSLV